MKGWVTSAAAIAIALSAHASSAAGSFPPPVQVDKLPNGLTVVTVPFDSPGIVAYYTLVGAGARDEVEPGKSGYAHLFEHLMFRGTDKIPPAEYNRRLQAMGAEDNANTSSERTLYTTTIPKEALDDLIAVNADRFQHLHYAPDKYKDETGAVLGERNKVFSNPEAQMYETIDALAFKVHTYGHTTIGSKRDVADMPNQYAYSLSFFKRFYTPDDTTIFVVGDFDRAHALEQIKAAYGGWTGKRARTNVKPEPEQREARETKIDWDGPTDPRLFVGYKVATTGTNLADAAAYATLIAATFGKSSDLYQRLVVRDAKVLSLDADPTDVIAHDPKMFVVASELKGSTSFDDVIGAVQGAINAVARGELGAAKVEAARDHVMNEAILRAQTPGALASQMAWLAVTTGDPHGLERWMSALAAVKADDVVRVAKTLVPAHRDVVTLVSAPQGAKKPAAKGAKK